MDLGTSGIRAQAIDLDGNTVVGAAITTRHPLPGANVMDHLHFAIEAGTKMAHRILIRAVNRVIGALGVAVDRIVRLAICGNPIQVSLFQDIEIRDLAYAGKRKREALGIIEPQRNAVMLTAGEIGGLALAENARVLIPPAVRHEIGADSLAMMIKTGILEKKQTAIVTDYGTNAEMALVADGTIYTGSTAAGPALEGQQISHGMLALPGAISDVAYDGQGLRTAVLDKNMAARTGDTVDPLSGRRLGRGQVSAKGITGTGVIALIAEAMRSGLIRLPTITGADHAIHLADGITFTEKDLAEAGKAIGAIRAGHLSLCKTAGIGMDEVRVAYMAGASGTYVDAIKARDIGLVPPMVKEIFQAGNTSLAMARDMVNDPDELWRLEELSEKLRQHHVMFATSEAFEKAFVLELSYWTEGMSMEQFKLFLRKFDLPDLPPPETHPAVVRTGGHDMGRFGRHGLSVIDSIDKSEQVCFSGCTGCGTCIAECPESALQIENDRVAPRIGLNLSRCNGLGCGRCEQVCPENVFEYKQFIAIP
jgi:methylamine methyltransferase corrinoid protein reductive activase